MGGIIGLLGFLIIAAAFGDNPNATWEQQFAAGLVGLGLMVLGGWMLCGPSEKTRR